MKLKEFVIWAYKLPLEDAGRISNFSRSVLAHFERSFNPIVTDGVYRVIIKITDDPALFGNIEHREGVLIFNEYFDIESFEKESIESKKLKILNLMLNSVIELCDTYGWCKNNFIAAYEKVIGDNFKNHYIYKSKWNRKKSLQAKIFCEHESDFFRCSLIVDNKDGVVIFKSVLFDTKPQEYKFNERLGNISWINNDTLKFTNVFESKEFAIS